MQCCSASVLFDSELSMSIQAACRIIPLSLCSISTTGSSTWRLPTTMTLSTSSAVLEVLSAWRPWVWCSLTTCCRTWREASRPRSCGSASPWRWQPSPPEQHAQGESVLGLGLRSPIQRPLSLQHCYCHCTEPATFMLSGSVRDLAPCYVDSNTAHRQYNQLPYPWPTETSFSICVFVHQSSEEKPGHLPAVLCSWLTPHSCFIMVHVCATVELKYTLSFFHLTHLFHFP